MVLKKGFTNRCKYEDMVEYREIFLKKIRLFLSYFIEFSKEGSILEKNYLDNYKIDEPD